MGDLRDRPGHVRAVAVIVVGVGAIGDEVVGLHEAEALQILDGVERAVILVGDAGVEHRDDHPLAVGELPRVGHADLAHVPLLGVAGVVGEAGPAVLGRRDLGGDHLARRQRVHRVGLGDLDATGAGQRGEDRVGAIGRDVGAVDLLVASLVGDQHQIDAVLALDRRDQRRAGVIAQIDDHVIRIGADGGDPIGLDARVRRALVGRGAQVPPQHDHSEQHQEPQHG